MMMMRYRGEVDSEGQDDEGHDLEHRLHGRHVGVINARLRPQLRTQRGSGVRGQGSGSEHTVR